MVVLGTINWEKMRASVIILSLTLLPVCLPAATLQALTPVDTSFGALSEGQLESLGRQLGRELSNLTTAEVEKRNRNRREVQQRGYANTLLELISEDSLGALLAFLKTNLQIQIFLPHDRVYIYQPLEKLNLAIPITFTYEDGMEITLETKKARLALKEGWQFPVDPWRKD